MLDDEQLAEQLGHKPELSRQFSLLSMIGMAFAILNSWTALAASLSLALPSGGPTSVLWGLVVAGVCNGALAASLAEFLSAIPSAGGQYEWVAATAPQRLKAPLSFVTGYINTGGWIALTCTGGSLASQLIVGIIALWNPDYEATRWQQFLLYIGYTIVAFLINAFGNSFLSQFNQAALIWSLTGFVVICITVLACSSGRYASAEFVFTDFVNETGWPGQIFQIPMNSMSLLTPKKDGIAWLLGLLQGSLGLIGYDATAHMIE